MLYRCVPILNSGCTTGGAAALCNRGGADPPHFAGLDHIGRLVSAGRLADRTSAHTGARGLRLRGDPDRLSPQVQSGTSPGRNGKRVPVPVLQMKAAVIGAGSW